MHPIMIMSVAREVDSERQRKQHGIQPGSMVLADRADVRSGASRLVRRLRAGISLRLRLS